MIGAGGHGRSLAEAAELSGKFEVAGFVDDGAAAGSLVMGYPVVGPTTDLTVYRAMCDQAIVAIGNNGLRETLVNRLVQAGIGLATVIHPSAIVSPRAMISDACAVMAGAIIGTEAQLGLGAIVNSGAVVDHHAKVHDFGHLGVNTCMAGGAILGAKAWIQAGCALGYGVEVGAGVVLAPGTAVKAC